jgi:hypothetical protein
MSSLFFSFVTVTHSPSSFHLLINTQSQIPPVVGLSYSIGKQLYFLLFCDYVDLPLAVEKAVLF